MVYTIVMDCLHNPLVRHGGLSFPSPGIFVGASPENDAEYPGRKFPAVLEWKPQSHSTRYVLQHAFVGLAKKQTGKNRFVQMTCGF